MFGKTVTDVRPYEHYDARLVLLSSSAQGRVSDARGDGDAYIVLCVQMPLTTTGGMEREVDEI